MLDLNESAKRRKIDKGVYGQCSELSGSKEQRKAEMRKVENKSLIAGLRS